MEEESIDFFSANKNGLYRIQSIKRLAGPRHPEHKLAEQRNEAFLHPIGTYQ